MVLEGVARAPQVETLRLLTAEEDGFLVIMTRVLHDPELHRSRVDGQGARRPSWCGVDWSHVEESRKSWDPNMSIDLKVDTAKPLSTIRSALVDHLTRVP